MYDSDVKLYYNDYNIEYAGAKATAAQNLVKSLKARGIQIDGVGLQGHFIVGQTPSQASSQSLLSSFTALGVEVAYTELDIRFTSLPPTTAGLAQQGTDYANTVLACVATTGCVGVTIWDFTDKYSWIPSTFSGQGEACLWYSDYTLHPAYYSVVSALGGAPAQTSAPSSTKTSIAVTTTTSKPAATTTSKPATTTTSTPPTTSTVPKYGQCGGLTWTGSTVCAAGSTCKAANAYYSQCL